MEGLGSKGLCREVKLCEGLVILWKQKKLHSVRQEKKITGNRVKCKALGSEERSHHIFEGLAQMTPAQVISSVGKLGARDVVY